jgi:DNA-binding NtrC family response regulator
MYHILYVDDDASMRELMRVALERDGFFIHAVPTAEVALMLLKEQIHFDLLMTDVVIPGGMNGFELAEQATKLQPGLRVIYLTGFVNLPRCQIAQLRGKLVYKPVLPSQLEIEIRGLLAA